MKCNQCGTCCKLFLIDLDEEEYRSKRYKTIFDEFYDNFDEAVENAANIIAQNEDGSCIYLKDGKCSIHESRPKACRAFFCDSKRPEDQKKIGIIMRYKSGKKEMFSRKGMKFQI